MRLPKRTFAAAAVIAAAATGVIFAAAPASASSAPCWRTTSEPITVSYVIGETTIYRVPNGVDWSDCIG